MKCSIKNRSELIVNYLTGELPEDEAKIFEEHYFQCEICFKELKIAEDAISLISREGPAILAEGKPSANKNLRNIIKRLKSPGLSVPKRRVIAFATFAVMIIIFIMIFINRNDEGVLPDKVITKEEESQEYEVQNEKFNRENEELIAELTGPAFEPVPYLEEWITENVRSENDKIDTVLSPMIGEKFDQKDIIFKWRMADKEIVSLKILNNLEKEIFTSDQDQTQFPIFNIKVDSRSFKESGLYYWRIENEDEVLYVGKFYFLKKP